MERETIITIVFALVAVYLAWVLVLAKLFDRFLLEKLTGVPDIERAALPREGGKIKGTAVIAGGSYGGLITSRVLSTHFERVVIVESEQIADPDQPRKNVQQYWQVHTILQYTYGALSRLFPDAIEEAVQKANGRISRTVCNYFSKGGTVKSSPDNMISPWLCMSRPGFEPMIRKLIISSVPNVEFLNGTVLGFSANAARDEVSSVSIRIKEADGSSGDTIDMPVKLLVDCTGPSLAGVKWLRANKYPVPDKVQYSPNVKYWTILFNTSKAFRKSVIWPNGKTWDDQEVWLYASAPDLGQGREYAIALQRTEKKELMIAVLGWGKDCAVPGPDCTLEELVDFVADGDKPLEFFRKVGRDLIAYNRSLGPEPKGARMLFSTCYKFDYLNCHGLPKNFVLVGDSRLRVNPTYGQGILKCTVGAIALDAALRQHTHDQELDNDFANKYFKKEASRVDGLYDFTKSEDYAFPGTDVSDGEDRSFGRFNRFYMSNLIKATHKDSKLGTTFWSTVNCVRPSTDLFTPGVIFAVLKTALLSA